jgi:hypothetical protein
MTSRRLVTSASNTAVSSRSLLTPGSSVSPLLFARAALARAKSAAPGHGCLEVGALAPAEDDQRTQFLLSRGTLSAAGGAPAVPLIACRPASTGASGRSLAPEDTRVLAGPTRGGPCRLVPVARGAVDQLGRCQDARLADGRVARGGAGCARPRRLRCLPRAGPPARGHLLRRRKPRPKPVPEGQLALFGRPGGHEETGSLGAEGLLSPV